MFVIGGMLILRATCRGGGSAQFPSYESSHGSGPVPLSVKRCIEDKTRWEKKAIKLSVPIPNTSCCENKEYTSWAPSTSGIVMPNNEITVLSIVTCVGAVVVIIMLSPVGL